MAKPATGSNIRVGDADAARGDTAVLEGFAPLAAPGAGVLVLGTMPGARSLADREYYAHPQNAFWRIMAALFDFDATKPYAERVEALTGAGVAVWDVLRACRRTGSLDTAIEPATEVANDFVTFFADQPGLRLLAFNGGGAAALFRRHARRQLQGRALPPTVRLPSTSPTHARATVAAKLQAWRVIAETIEGSVA